MLFARFGAFRDFWLLSFVCVFSVWATYWWLGRHPKCFDIQQSLPLSSILLKVTATTGDSTTSTAADSCSFYCCRRPSPGPTYIFTHFSTTSPCLPIRPTPSPVLRENLESIDEAEMSRAFEKLRTMRVPKHPKTYEKVRKKNKKATAETPGKYRQVAYVC